MFLLFLFTNICLASRVTHNQAVNAAELSNLIYKGATNMGKTDGTLLKYAKENNAEDNTEYSGSFDWNVVGRCNK